MCELDLVFHFLRCFAIIDEVVVGGVQIESSKQIILVRCWVAPNRLLLPAFRSHVLSYTTDTRPPPLAPHLGTNATTRRAALIFLSSGGVSECGCACLIKNLRATDPRLGGSVGVTARVTTHADLS